MSYLYGKFREMICDKDLSVMFVVVCVLYELVVYDFELYKNLLLSFVSVFK